MKRLLLAVLLIITGCQTSTSEFKPIGGGGIVTGITLSSNPTSISTFGLASISATVRDADGVLVGDGATVTFSLSDSSLGALSSSTATTSNGIARVTFTAAGNTGAVTITATSGSFDATITIPISASATSAISMTASPFSIPVGATTTIIAHVVDITGNPVQDGTLVYFAIDDPSQGALSSANAFTNNGDATITFTASSTGGGIVNVFAVSGETTGNIEITISGGVVGGELSLSVSPSSISTSGISTITATVLDSAGLPVIGANVNFALNNTLATLSSNSAITNSLGAANVTLVAGTTAGSVTISASTSSLTDLEVVTITQATGAGVITVIASPQTISINETSSIIATVLDGLSNPVSGRTVNFSLSSNSVGSLSSESAVTDATGVASVIFTAGSSPATVTVSANAQLVNASTTVSIQATAPQSVDVAVNPSSITVFGTSTISATVRDSAGDPIIDGTPVNFALSSESFGSLSSALAYTANSNGTATTTFTANNTAGTVTITATSGTIRSTVSLTVTPAATGSIQFDSATPPTLGIKGSGQSESSIVKFLVNDINGNPATDGTAVSYTMKGPGGGEYIGSQDGSPSTETGSTASGLSSVILNSGSIAGPVVITASTNINSGDETTLSAEHDSSSTTISVGSTSGFPETGRLRIDNELIDYTGLTSSSFTGCTRGAVATVAGVHSSGAKVFGQNQISTSASQISIGGGVPSATHFSLSASTINLPGLSKDNKLSDINILIADRFGNYNVLDKTSVSFYTEGGAVDTQGIADETGSASVIFRTQAPLPVDVDRATAGGGISTSYFRGANEPWYLAGDGLTRHPRDGWSAVMSATQGEEKFLDENVNGLFTRSYATSVCPIGHTCECDGGVTNGYSSFVTGGDACSSGKRSEGFMDLGEPFYDVDDDGVRDNGLSAGNPFELYIDSNGNAVYNSPNGLWDGPDCLSSSCEKNKMIWEDLRIVFSGAPIFLPRPAADNCYNLPSENAACSAQFDADYPDSSYVVAPASIGLGGVGTFAVIVGDQNLNTIEPGSTLSATTSGGTVFPSSTTIGDGLSTGPTVYGFTVSIPGDFDKTSVTVTVTVTTEDFAPIFTLITVPIL